MAIEIVTHIDDLNATYPTATDDVSEGDDHIRNIKTALKTDFPSITDVVTASHTDLNRCDITTIGKITAGEVVTADGSGNIDCNNANFTNVDIDTGTIAGAVTGATQSAGDNSTRLATTAYADRVSGIGYLKVKSLTGTLNNDSTVDSDGELKFIDVATGKYKIELMLYVSANGTDLQTTGFKWGFVRTGWDSANSMYNASIAVLTAGNGETLANTFASELSTKIAGANFYAIHIVGTMEATNSINELTLQWAQETATAVDTYLVKNSWMSMTAENS